MLSGIMSADTELYERLLHFNIDRGGNLLVFGQAGIGKTEIPFQIAKAKRLRTVYWNLSTQEAPDLVGLPLIKVVDGSEVVEYAAPSYMPIASRTPEPVMVVIDELDKAKPDLQNPLLEVCQQHTINGRELNIKCIVATGNLPEEGAFSKPVSHALTNRFQVYQLTTNFDAWQQWAAREQKNPLVIGFLSKNAEYLSRPPIQGDPTAYTRCSPRSWTKAADDLDGTDSSTDTVDFQTMIIAGRVGMEPAAKFRVWLDHYRFLSPMIDALVKKGEMPNVNDMPIDRVLVLALSSCGAIAQASRKTAKTAAERDKVNDVVGKTASNVFKLISVLPPEFQMAAVKSALSIEMVQAHGLTKLPDVMKTYLKIRQAIR